MDKRKRLISLQAVKTLAFLGIITSHIGITQLGAWGVSVFFCLLGFLMVYNYYDIKLDSTVKNSVNFGLKKISKLYVLHILMMTAAFISSNRLFFQNISFDDLISNINKVVLNIFLIQAWIPNSSVYFSLNGVAWFLSVCIFLYTVFPYILGKIKKLSCNQTAILCMIIIWIIQTIIGAFSKYIYPLSDNFSYWIIYIFPLFRMGDFIIGCVLGFIFINKKYENIKPATATVLELSALVLIVFTQYIFEHSDFLGVLRYTMLYTPTTIFLIYIFAVNRGLVSKILSCMPIIYVGNLTAYAFLIHTVAIQYVESLYLHTVGGRINNIFLKFILVFLATIICSEIYRRTEKWVKTKSKQLINKG